jgi:hypothetical protein
MIETPVGARCRECARLYKLPTFRVSGQNYLRAIGAAIVMAGACGAAWWAVNLVLHFAYLNLILGPAAGYAIGEVIGLAVNRKRGAGLSIIASVAVVAGYGLSIVLPPPVYPILLADTPHLIFDIIAVGLGVSFAVSRLR